MPWGDLIYKLFINHKTNIFFNNKNE
jgi:hypothetical protein